ncbi:hypothetical protein BU23DRAFT_643276 [Bimuria novae-zelandiae CBS 107.79]|uniref:Uncharacterized protein n=1 Tax=Bimuria novae-zelandiae CBS 107.79 TaxID=1447943 RepID=A0A6A5V9C6_9PLEO|nr:hypothetical protein BU23DRAFT_643276 [Bimuria novae-zelandiae CBS 107.79]
MVETCYSTRLTSVMRRNGTQPSRSVRIHADLSLATVTMAPKAQAEESTEGSKSKYSSLLREFIDSHACINTPIRPEPVKASDTAPTAGLETMLQSVQEVHKGFKQRMDALELLPKDLEADNDLRIKVIEAEMSCGGRPLSGLNYRLVEEHKELKDKMHDLHLNIETEQRLKDGALNQLKEIEETIAAKGDVVPEFSKGISAFGEEISKLNARKEELVKQVDKVRTDGSMKLEEEKEHHKKKVATLLEEMSKKHREELEQLKKKHQEELDEANRMCEEEKRDLELKLEMAWGAASVHSYKESLASNNSVECKLKLDKMLRICPIYTTL